MVLSMVLTNSLFSLRDINLTLGLLPPRRHVVWRDSVSVESSRSELKSKCADIFHQSFFWLLRRTEEPQRGRNCLRRRRSKPSSAWAGSVLISFGVVLMSCRVNFHVVRSRHVKRENTSLPVDVRRSVFCLQNLIRPNFWHFQKKK